MVQSWNLYLSDALFGTLTDLKHSVMCIFPFLECDTGSATSLTAVMNFLLYLFAYASRKFF